MVYLYLHLMELLHSFLLLDSSLHQNLLHHLLLLMYHQISNCQILFKIISILFVDHGSCSPWDVTPRRLIWVVSPGLPTAFAVAQTISSPGFPREEHFGHTCTLLPYGIVVEPSPHRRSVYCEGRLLIAQSFGLSPPYGGTGGSKGVPAIHFLIQHTLRCEVTITELIIRINQESLLL